MAENNDKEYLTLCFEDGEDVEYEVMGAIDVEGKEYLVLIPETDKDSIEIYGLEEVPDEPDQEEIVTIEDDAEYMKVIEALKAQGLNIEVEG
jgi:uncharacterized protein YrzB (UPF0473 family)